MFPQALQALGMTEDLAPLLDKRGERRRALMLLGHADLQDLRGLLASRRPTKGGQAKGEASRIVDLAHPMAFAHAKERCDRIGPERHAHVSEP